MHVAQRSRFQTLRIYLKNNINRHLYKLDLEIWNTCCLLVLRTFATRPPIGEGFADNLFE